MANIEQSLRRSSKHRYSIDRLLALSDIGCSHFDLSKFSFDAARAGVVPSLSDCATVSRRTSGNRPRMSSAESACTVENATTSTARETIKPEHDPQPPPHTLLAQQHIGFARFLKKHSSPTHQRVTAGGRIVPMEAQRPPPVFALAVNDGIKSDSYRYQGNQELLESKQCPAMREVLPETLRTKDVIRPSVISATMFPEVNNPENTVSAQNHYTQAHWVPQSIGSNVTGFMPDATMIRPFPQVVDMEQLPVICASYVPVTTASYDPWQSVCPVPAVPSHTIAGTWLCNDGMVPLGVMTNPMTPNPFVQPVVWAQSALADWTHHYDELDLQLKALDRHRAMTSLTSDIASQRREIVQQRADSKNMINLISSWLNLSEQIQPGVGTDQSVSNFNADAPSYIPVAQHTSQMNHGCLEKKQVGIQEAVNEGPPPRSKRRPIPIIPPPKLESSSSSPKSESVLSLRGPGQDIVDPWGVKVGPAPPELRKQQSEILESISELPSQSSYNSRSEESLLLYPEGGVFNPDLDATASDGVNQQKLPRQADSMVLEAASVPQKIKAMYQDGLDALRKSRGIVTTVEMPDGTSLEIEGQDLQRPDLVNMSRFEKDYWLTVLTPSPVTKQQEVFDEIGLPDPVLVTPPRQAQLQNQQDLPDLSLNSETNRKENLAFTPTARRKAATDAFLSRFNDGEDLEDMSLLQCNPRPFSGRGPLNQNIERQMDNAPPQSTSFDVLRDTNHSELQVQSRDTHSLEPFGSDRFQNLGYGSIQNAADISTDAFNNKGYSSISVQNVHAVAQLPQNLDGTTDMGKRSRSILSLVGKVKSPRLLRRTTGNGGA